jgi:hypothetical protein
LFSDFSLFRSYQKAFSDENPLTDIAGSIFRETWHSPRPSTFWILLHFALTMLQVLPAIVLKKPEETSRSIAALFLWIAQLCCACFSLSQVSSKRPRGLDHVRNAVLDGSMYQRI